MSATTATILTEGVKTTITHPGRGVAEFLARHGKDVTGVISGFDRLRLQGSLRHLYCPELMAMYLERAGVLYKDFKGHVTAVTAQLPQVLRQGQCPAAMR